MLRSKCWSNSCLGTAVIIVIIDVATECGARELYRAASTIEQSGKGYMRGLRFEIVTMSFCLLIVRTFP